MGDAKFWAMHYRAEESLFARLERDLIQVAYLRSSVEDAGVFPEMDKDVRDLAYHYRFYGEEWALNLLEKALEERERAFWQDVSEAHKQALWLVREGLASPELVERYKDEPILSRMAEAVEAGLPRHLKKF